MKAFTDSKIGVTEKFKYVLVRVENIVEKGENAGYQHFLLFLQCFQKVFLYRLIKYRDYGAKCWSRLGRRLLEIW